MKNNINHILGRFLCKLCEDFPTAIRGVTFFFFMLNFVLTITHFGGRGGRILQLSRICYQDLASAGLEKRS